MEKLLRSKDVAELLDIKVSTLAVWRCTGKRDLPYIKNGGLIRYEKKDVIKFAKSYKRNKFKKGD